MAKIKLSKIDMYVETLPLEFQNKTIHHTESDLRLKDKTVYKIMKSTSEKLYYKEHMLETLMNQQKELPLKLYDLFYQHH